MKKYFGKGNRPRVLHLDEDPFVRKEYNAELTESAEFDVHSCASVSQFEKRLETDLNWDVVVMDVMMPPDGTLDLGESDDGLLSGVLLCRRHRSRLPTTQLVILTNRTASDFREHLRDVPGVQVLSKYTTTPLGLPSALKKILDGD